MLILTLTVIGLILLVIMLSVLYDTVGMESNKELLDNLKKFNDEGWTIYNYTDDIKTEMVSSCCGVEIIEGDRSDCCDAKMWANTDICGDCKEHTDTYEVCGECGEECDEIEDYEYKALAKESYEEMMRDGNKDEY